MPDDPFAALDEAARRGPEALVGRLIELADRSGNADERLAARLLAERLRLGLPVWGEPEGPPVSPETRTAYEKAADRIARALGRELLERGEIAAAWPIWRRLGETGPVAEAIERLASERPAVPRRRLSELIRIALHEGAHPAAGLRLAVEAGEYGAAFDFLAEDESIGREERSAAAAEAIQRLHGDLSAALLRAAGEPAGSPEGAVDLAHLIAKHPGVAEGDPPVVDPALLRRAVRVSPWLEAGPALECAIDLCRAGESLPARLRRPGPPPFEAFFTDHRILLSGLAGRQVDAAVEHFIAKAEFHRRRGGEGAQAAGETLIYLLHRAGRPVPALAALNRYLATPPRGPLCPPLEVLCSAAGDFGP
ncbi:MAG: hypothetical protein D6718_02700, partial [Acidobacteria bacterium]